MSDVAFSVNIGTVPVLSKKTMNQFTENYY